MPTTLILIIAIIALFHILWYATSRLYQNRKIPGNEVLQEYQDRIMKQMNIAVDRSVMEETYIDANGYRLHLVVAAAGENAPTLVFIPGTTAYAQVYAQFGYEMYKQGFNMIGFDPRGHGQSSGPRGDYTINGLVDDALAVTRYARQRFGGKVALAGSSQGGIVAFYAAARHTSPDATVDAAVCHNIADLNGNDNLILSLLRPPKFLVPAARFLMTLYGRFSIPISLYLDLSKETFPDGTNAATLVRNDPLAVSRITFRALNSLTRTDLPTPVEKIPVPIMVIHAGKDNIFPQSYIEDIYNRLACPKKYLLLEDTEHLVMTNNVNEVVPPVAEWLKGIMA
ncbi:MAG: alpha/beta fold hydrolase [Thermodesulfobacteriota bacterium]|nr:alpha/beta fold hydrolase [Thermodesulfobacteriota bacterium]